MADKLIRDLAAGGALLGTALLEVDKGSGSSVKSTVTEVTAIETAARAAQDDIIEASVGLTAAGAYPPFSGSNFLDASTDVIDALGLLDTAIAGTNGASVQVSISNIKTVGGTPVQIFAAAGSGVGIEIISASMFINIDSQMTWASAPEFVLYYETVGKTDPICTFDGSGIEGASNYSQNFKMGTGVRLMNDNQRIMLTTDDATDATLGTAAAEVFVFYRTITPA